MGGTRIGRAACLAAGLAGWLVPCPAGAVDIAEGVRLTGDLRVRHESKDVNAAFPGDELDHARIRARVGLGAKLDENWDLAFRFATGGGMTSTNQDLDALNDRVELYVDRAFARYRTGESRRFELQAGRSPNPYMSSPILWDADYNPDGLVEKLALEGESVGFFVNAGQHVLGQVSATDDSYGPWFFALQPGASFGGEWGSLSAAVCYYSFLKAGGVHSVPPGANYAITDIYVTFKTQTAGGLPISAWADWLTNPEARARRTACGAGLTVGSAEGKGNVCGAICYAVVERDAMWLDLGDNDYCAGLTTEDVRAFVLGVSFGLGQGAVFRAKWCHADSMSTDAVQDLIQADLAFKF